MTPDKLAELDALYAKSAPIWEYDGDIHDVNGDPVCEGTNCDDDTNGHNLTCIVALHNSYLDLSATIKALRAEREWQPIETAPKDGTTFLAYRSGIIMMAQWRKSHNGHMANGGEGWFYPSWNPATHWMPLPAPPAIRARSASESIPKENRDD